jgi:hypothetical protein
MLTSEPPNGRGDQGNRPSGDPHVVRTGATGGPVPHVVDGPLGGDELAAMDAWWRAANYLALGQTYLTENPLLDRPLASEQIKPTLLGHWGSTPGLNFIYIHLNRIIRRHDLDLIYIAGPGHCGHSMIAGAYLDGTYTEVYPSITMDRPNCQRYEPEVDVEQEHATRGTDQVVRAYGDVEEATDRNTGGHGASLLAGQGEHLLVRHRRPLPSRQSEPLRLDWFHRLRRQQCHRRKPAEALRLPPRSRTSSGAS